MGLRPSLLLFFFFTVCGEVFAATAENIAADFQPLSGYVVERQGEAYIVDLDTTDGLSVGDLITVLGSGKPLTHPVTGEVLGKLETTKGILKVTRIESGFSWTRPLQPATGIQRGDMIRRYGGIAAVFRDYTNSGERFYGQLKDALPNLEWQGYATVTTDNRNRQGPDDRIALIFELRQQGLTVRDAESQLLQFYPNPRVIRKRVPAPIEKPAHAAEPMPRNKDPAPRGDSIVTHEVQYPELEQLTNVRDKVIMADFLPNDGRLLLATTDTKSIRVFDVSLGLQRVAHSDRGKRDKILALHWWQPDAQQAPLLATTVWSGQRVQGALYALRSDGLVLLRDRIPYILATFDRDGDRQPELLLGQSFDRETFFGRKIRQLKWVEESLKEQKLDFEVPQRFAIQGAAFADLTGDGQQEIVFIRNNVLYIYGSNNQLLYRSSSQLGGSIASVTYEIDPAFEFSPVKTVPFELAPVVTDLDGDGIPELVTVASERSPFVIPGLDSGITKSWLSVLEFREGSFLKGKLGPELELPLQGLTASDDRMVLLTPESHSFFGGRNKQSKLWGLPLEAK
jgi:hypothetical protein